MKNFRNSEKFRHITERKQQTRKIESLAKFPFENPNPVFRIDGNGTILCGNVAATLLTKWNSKVDKRVPERISQVVAAVLASNKRIELEETFGAKTFSLLFVPIALEGYVNIYANYITERKKAEEASKKLAVLIDLSPDAIVIKKMDETITFWSAGAEKLYGYTKQEVLGQKINILLKAKDSKLSDEIITQLKQGKNWTGEITDYTKNNNEIIVQSNWSAILDAQGNIVEILESNVDVTQRKKAELVVFEAREYAQNIMATMRESLLVLDDNLRVVSANDSFYRTFEVTPKETEGNCIYELGDNQWNIPKLRELLEKIIPEQQFFAGFEVEHDFPKIGRRTMLLNARQILQRVKGASLILVAFEDITERKKMQKQLIKSEKMVAIGELASMVGHDLRNPLQVIKNSAYFLKKKGTAISEAQAKEMLEIIDKAIDHSDKIINDMRDYSREMHLELTEYAARILVDEAARMIQVPNRIQVVNHVHEETLIWVDADKMMRVFINLMKNAIDAMPEMGTLEINSRQTGDRVEIVFSDTGTGIPKEILSQIFMPLFTTKAQGMGFGLPICKRIVEAHGGTITVKTEVNKGTTFTVTLPFKSIAEVGGEKTWINMPESLLLTTTKT